MKQLEGRPFALLGVNTDRSPFELKAIQDKAGLTWPSWWDGPPSPITTAMQVDRFPTFFLIDQEGVVRLRHVGVPPDGLLEKKIEELLKKKTDEKETRS